MERGTGESTAPSALPGSRPTNARATSAGEGYLHVGAVVPSHAAVLDTLIRFVDEGLRAGDLPVLSCPPETVAEVVDVLGERAGQVDADQRLTLVGARPPDAFVVARKLLDRAARAESGRLRIAAEVHRSGDPLEWREGERYESASNAVLAGAQVTALCVYDRSVVPAPLVAAVERTHPLLLADGGSVPSTGYLEPRSFVRLLPVPREAVEGGRPVFAVDDVPTLSVLRHILGAVLEDHVPDEDQRGDLHLALSEVAANAFRHGVRPVSARVWADAARIVCTITDRGSAFVDPIAGYVPAHGPDLGRGGMGLWLARKLWDIVDLVAGDGGFTVRLSTRLV